LRSASNRSGIHTDAPSSRTRAQSCGGGGRASSCKFWRELTRRR
jgi:hypothetical protein